MAQKGANRLTVRMEGDFVVFLIGMRINHIWKVWKWWPASAAMSRMIKELSAQPGLGLLQAYTRAGFRNLMVVQYWRSVEHLQAYAANPDNEHLPAWRDFNRHIAASGAVGVWHETYLVPEKAFEALYINMGPIGLGKAGTVEPATGRKATAKGRLGQADGTDAPDA